MRSALLYTDLVPLQYTVLRCYMGKGRELQAQSIGDDRAVEHSSSGMTELRCLGNNSQAKGKGIGQINTSTTKIHCAYLHTDRVRCTCLTTDQVLLR